MADNPIDWLKVAAGIIAKANDCIVIQYVGHEVHATTVDIEDGKERLLNETGLLDEVKSELRFFRAQTQVFQKSALPRIRTYIILWFVSELLAHAEAPAIPPSLPGCDLDDDVPW